MKAMTQAEVEGVQARLARAERIGPAQYAIRLRQQLANLIKRAHVAALAEDKARAARALLVVVPESPRVLAAREAAGAVVGAFLDAASALLDCAGDVGDEDAADVAEMLGILASWWPPAADGDEDNVI